MNRTAKSLLFEPPIRLLVKALLSNHLARHWAFEWAALYDAIGYPAYALGLQTACRYASLAGAKGFTAIECGVAGGNGLRELSSYATAISRKAGLEIYVTGFDTGVGLPPSSDYRDAPWHWQSGDFPCDVPQLLNALPSATEVVLGRIEETLPDWLSSKPRLPIGFVSVDVDYFSSTSAILQALGVIEPAMLLPFVSLYFDDLLRFLTPRVTGEFAAITDFNSSNTQRKLDRDDWMSEDRPFSERLWLKRMYTLCCFDHPALNLQQRELIHRLDLVKI